MNDYWEGRGAPWEYDPGPPKNRSWPRLFAETPNYRALGTAVIGHEQFRWHFGPMFYRGRLGDNQVKVVVIGQEGAQDESLAHRSFTGGTGARMQYFLNYLGITRSYLFLNTFVYPIFGQYSGDKLRWLAQDPDSPIVKHRHKLYNYVLARNDVHLIIAVGNAAKESVVTWVTSRGGTCPQGASDVSQCSGTSLDPHTRLIGVLHPGGAGQGGSVTAIKADFVRAAQQIKDWMDADPAWLPPDPDGERQLDEPYVYRSAPIPFRDFPIGTNWRLGRGGTSSNRKDNQRSIQIFSEDGEYNDQGDDLQYSDQAPGDAAGYADEAGDVPYEPPKNQYREYDKGPGSSFARLLMGGKPGLAWPDFNALGAHAHPSFGTGPIYRGRPDQARVLILADQQSHDDLFNGRALTGESGQHMQPYLEAIGLREDYLILRVLPVDILDLSPAQASAIVDHPQVCKVYQAIVDRVRGASHNLGLVLTFGPQANRLAQSLDLGGLPHISLKAWKQAGSLANWQSRLADIQQVNYAREINNPSFLYDGRRGQIPRVDLPYGVLRWMGTSGDRARQPTDQATHEPAPDYYKIYLPDWVYDLDPEPLSSAEQSALQHVP
jgi:uracil-DNA glycosylase